jgi:hypothetical protein
MCYRFLCDRNDRHSAYNDGPKVGGAHAGSLYMIAVILIRQNGRKKKKVGGGQRKLLKRLIPNKGIQGNQSFFLGKIWPDLEPAWLDFEKLGVGFERRKLRLRRISPPSLKRARCAKTHGIGVAKSRLNSQIRARRPPAQRCAGVFLENHHRGGQDAVRPNQVEYRL